MAKNFKDEDVQDNDPTDELPILTEAVIAAHVERTATMRADADDDDTGTYVMHAREPDAPAATSTGSAHPARIEALEAELASLEQRWRSTCGELAERDAEIERLRAVADERASSVTALNDSLSRIGESLEERDAKIASLEAALDSTRSHVKTLEDTARSLEQQIVALEAAQSVPDEPDEPEPPTHDSDATRELRESVAALSQHIENRNAIWERQIAEVEQKSARIRELEIELNQRQARQHDAERHAELEAARARELRSKLLSAEHALERQAHAAPPAEAATLSSPPSRGPAQLRDELRRAIDLQIQSGENTEDLRRLEDLEAAIRELEQQMDGPVSDAAEAPRVKPELTPEPARLVCLTGDDLGNLELDSDVLTIGRGSHCEIRIATHYVSREHARLTASDGRWIIEDLGSRNGVFVNAVRIERQPLDDNDLITIGDTQFRYQAGSPLPA